MSHVDCVDVGIAKTYVLVIETGDKHAWEAITAARHWQDIRNAVCGRRPQEPVDPSRMELAV